MFLYVFVYLFFLFLSSTWKKDVITLKRSGFEDFWGDIIKHGFCFGVFPSTMKGTALSSCKRFVGSGNPLPGLDIITVSTR